METKRAILTGVGRSVNGEKWEWGLASNERRSLGGLTLTAWAIYTWFAKEGSVPALIEASLTERFFGL